MLRRIARRGIPALAALLSLLAAFITPSAHAAATYDITQVGDAEIVSVKTDDGKELSEQTINAYGQNMTLNMRVGVDDMSKLAEGDIVGVRITYDANSYFKPWFFESINTPTSLEDKSGHKVFTIQPQSSALRLIRTGEPAVGSFSTTISVRDMMWQPDSGSSTTSTWHVGKNSTYRFSNQPWKYTPCTSMDTQMGAHVNNGAITATASPFNCDTVTRIATGADLSGISGDDLLLWIHLIPESGRMVDSFSWNPLIGSLKAADENHPANQTSNEKSRVDLIRDTSADVSTFAKAKANLKYGTYYQGLQSDGSYVSAVNYGSRLPGRPNSLKVRDDADDETTLKLMEKTGLIWSSSWYGINIHFADESIPNRVRVETQSTESAYRTTTLTTKPVEPAVGQGQSAIRYDPNGGDGDAFKKVGDPGTTATTAEAGVFLRKGHTFAGWNTKADGTGTAYQAGADVAYPAEGDTLTLYAQWEANTYKTEFRDWRGRTITSGMARYGTTPTVPALADTTWLADPDMNFDNVDGWRDDWWHGSPTFTKDGLTVNSRDTRANGKTVGANAAIHVEADADYSEANATNAAKGSGIGFNINNGSNSYRGWGACPNGRQCEVDAVLMAGLASSQTIEPWVQIANDRFNGYGTATVHRMQLTQVDPATHNGIARDGYVFTGWDKDPSKPVEGDTVYTARYRPAVYKVRFDANGGTGTMADQSHTYDRKQALTANAFAREGYRFTGWNTRGDGKGKAFTDKQTVTNLLAHDGATGVLYAQWERLPETALPWSGGIMTHNLTTILGGGASYPRHPIRPHAPAQAGLSHARRVM